MLKPSAIEARLGGGGTSFHRYDDHNDVDNSDIVRGLMTNYDDTAMTVEDEDHDDDHDNDHRKLNLCPYGNDWGDGTHVTGDSDYCCRSCTEPPNRCATFWPSNGLYRCGTDPFHGWKDGTVIATFSGWRCANGWSYWPSSGTYRCGKDTASCWQDGTRTVADYRTGCCNEPFNLNAESSGGFSTEWVCGASCLYTEATLTNPRANEVCPPDFDRNDQTPALYCSNGRNTNCLT